ncbi:MAG: GMC family oxidoreductase [Gemmatimonadales bacterium]
MSHAATEFDFIVVGSGAGGGPLAGNLAKHGFRVLLLEAGSATDNYYYQVPGFHGLASEDPELRWDYWVKHYEDVKLGRGDSKYCNEHEGILYPRAGTLGGCTAHNAMITLLPHDTDWDDIADLTGDKSWLGTNMHRYFERLECCQYLTAPGQRPKGALQWALHVFRTWARPGGTEVNPSGHGFKGWLRTNLADPTLALPDKKLLWVLWFAVARAVARGIELGPLKLARSVLKQGVQHFDPNDRREKESLEGICFTPLATNRGKRNGTREYIQAVAAQHPDKLVVKTECLVTKVLLDDGTPPRAVGVEYLNGPHLYRADPRRVNAPPHPGTHSAMARHEVVISAGAFNSPQLLMLSGIGPRAQLQQHAIPVRVDLPGVGENLQDRYEVGVVSELDRPFELLGESSFAPPVPDHPEERTFTEWRNGKGLYTSNGAVLGIMLRSTRRAYDPDLFVFGLPGFFKGYYPGYSKDLLQKRTRFTWAVLKGHTQNRAGQVKLRSKDPRDPPAIVFRYFDEGTDTCGEDLDAVVEGVLFARSIMKAAGGLRPREIVPGPDVKTRAEIAEFVKREAWGHHASCSNRMGPRSDPYAVVDSRFRVHGTRGLRVVDASVFPRIPGFFIVTAVYMISEKASDVLLQEAGVPLPRQPAVDRGALGMVDPTCREEQSRGGP